MERQYRIGLRKIERCNMNVFDVLREKLEQASNEMITGYFVRATEFKSKMLEIIDKTEQEYNNGWIPCSERLPDTKDNILICTSTGYVNVGYYSIDTFKDGNSMPYENVVAWRPLPVAYKEEMVTTNADRIRAMSDEELAMNMMCPNENGLGEIDCNKSDDCNCYECLINWLKKEVNT